MPLLSSTDVAQDDGDQIKICSATPFAEPVDIVSLTPIALGPQIWSWAVAASDPPGFYVSLPTQTDTARNPAHQFCEAPHGQADPDHG